MMPFKLTEALPRGNITRARCFSVCLFYFSCVHEIVLIPSSFDFLGVCCAH